ncbi:hypothetical protein [Enterobacter roggenkampii]|uniref:hypothetical protein n=1 Tax=Enterobacter roggenkampii TaxID=1812935 RepID=UPI002A7F5116|nr:hypothetical protein [Enterobacter roggenkampii]
MSNKYEDLIKNARMNADCGEHMSPEEVTTLLNVVETTFAALAAENAGLKAAGNKMFLSAISLMEDPELKIDHARDIKDWERIKTPATDAFLAEVRASAIPEGYVLVPQEMHLSSEAMEGICFHCGDGGFAFGEFTDGLLFVGAIDDSDGQKIHGLHIATADYPEEGCATICAFLPAPTEGAAQ